MSTRIALTYFGMDGQGATVKDAKADAGRKIESLLDDMSRAPHLYIMQADGWSALVTRSAHGWGYRIIAGPSEPLKSGPIYMDANSGESDEALRSCARHLLQAAWVHDIADDAAWVAAHQERLPIACRRADLRAELVSYFGWQRDYRRLRESGLSDAEAHAAARFGGRAA